MVHRTFPFAFMRQFLRCVFVMLPQFAGLGMFGPPSVAVATPLASSAPAPVATSDPSSAVAAAETATVLPCTSEDDDPGRSPGGPVLEEGVVPL